MQNFTISLGASGQFVSCHGYLQGTPVSEMQSIWNPGVYDELRNSYRVVDYAKLTQPFERLSYRDIPVIQQADFDWYGEVLVRLTNAVVGQQAHVNLGLLRGAYRPCVIVEVMTRGQVAYKFLNYTQHSEREAEVMAELRSLLRLSDPQTPGFHIQITDTAIGGYGAEHLAKMLIGIKATENCFQKQHWIVTFNLLHDARRGTNTVKMDAIQLLSSEDLRFSICRYEVPNLITEDYDAGLGLIFEDKTVKPCSEPGSFFLKSNAGIALVESAELKTTFDELYTQAVTDGLVTSPDYVQIADIWGQTQSK
ncbi:MAG TPA: hypothetical protein P5016_13080 [Verrucomicrobiales bacterium]|jgi:hypothetical protein|nr:hypothetical protein [Verrucomicrobiales bacterium]